MEIAVTGSSGLIGSVLMPTLAAAGHRPIAVVRRDPRPGADEIRWMPDKGEIDAAALDGVDAVINLAGAGIGDKRWTDAYKKVLVDSRVDGTALLVSTFAAMNRAPSVFLSGSAVGFYGDRGDTELTEADAAGDGFLPELVTKWEAAAAPAAEAGIRTVMLRTGVVLTPAGGALSRLLPLFKLGVGGKFGSGRQYMSWITIDDHIAATMHLLTADVSGPANVVGPNPVTNKELTSALGRVLGRPTLFPVPSFGPKLLVGSELADALLFESQRLSPTVLTGSGYSFQHPEIEGAFRAVLGKED
ncbi:MAG: TIGR01777 family oxidoreductase [Actinomycetota bacterium]